MYSPTLRKKREGWGTHFRGGDGDAGPSTTLRCGRDDKVWRVAGMEMQVLPLRGAATPAHKSVCRGPCASVGMTNFMPEDGAPILVADLEMQVAPLGCATVKMTYLIAGPSLREG